MMHRRIIDAVVRRFSNFPLLGACLLLGSSLVSVSANAQISGAITSDTVWTLASSPVNVSGNIVVTVGKTLTIEPGVVVRFAPGTGMSVEGVLVASGTVADTIVFTSGAVVPARGDWNGIEFVNTANVGSLLKYARVEWVGGGSASAGVYYRTGAFGVPLSNIHIRQSSNEGVNLRASSPVITSSRFELMDGYGVFSDLFSNFVLRNSIVEYCTEGGVRIPLNAAPTVDSTIIRYNGVGIYVDNGASPTIVADTVQSNVTGMYFRSVGGVQPTVRNNVISGNSEWGINAEGTTILDARRNYWGSEYGPFSEQINPSGRGNKVSVKVEVSPWRSSGTLSVTNITATIGSNTTWTAGVYWVKNNITVSTGVTLTLGPGVIVKMAPSTSISVSGALNIQSTYDSLAVFTSERDDSYGGDSNGDGDATAPAPANWNYVYLANATTLSNVIVKYGSHNLYLSNSATMSYVYSSVGNSYNVFGDGGVTSITLTDSYFTGSKGHGVYLTGANGAVVAVDRTQFLRNDGHGLYLGNGSVTSFDSSKAHDNTSFGVYVTQLSAATAQAFTGSSFMRNGQVGLSVGSQNSSPVQITNNVFEGNVQEGLLTSAASVLNNTFTGNRVPIALQLNVGSTYAGNIFTGNAYNNVTGLRSMYSSPTQLKGYLSKTTPAGLAAGVYLMIESEGVSTGDSLTIAPGVIVKAQASTSFSVDGVLIADGTPGEPIVFTSYRDHSVGGKINLISDTLAPATSNWSGVYVNGTPVRSLFDNVKFYYGTYGVYSTGSWTNQITNMTIERNSHGIYLGSGNVVLDAVTARYNDYGITSVNTTDLTVRNSVISNNATHGLQHYATYSTPIGGIRELSNSTVNSNGQRGVSAEPVLIPQVFVGNTINGNGRHGIWNVNLTAPNTDVQYIGNTVSNNGWDGIVSSQARYVDNHFIGNRYPIGMAGELGNLYVDNTGVDNNTFSANRRPAISIYSKSWNSGVSIADTLQKLFPVNLTSGVYVVEDGLSLGGDTLVIEPGVIVKFAQYQSLNANGLLVAEGTQAWPIVFTSYRDHSVGGKTNESSDTLKPARGDWSMFQLSGTGNVANSRLTNMAIRYANYGLYVTTQLSNPVRYVNLRHHNTAAVYVDGNYDLSIIGLTSDSSYAGVWTRNDAAATIDSALIRWNTYGLYGDYTYNGPGSGRFASVTNSTIGWNLSDGARILLGKEPQVFQDNLITGNGRHGIWNYSESATFDTLLLVSGNTISNNAETGVLTTRAYFVDDSLLNNKYPLGVTGELSRAGTGTQLGNFYSGNVLLGNTYNNVIVMYDNIWGTLGGTLPVDTVEYVHRLESSPTVPSGKSLTIAPGTVIKGIAGQALNATGALTSVGTSTKRITFTSWKDDTFGGDTNKDTTATTPAMGDWSYVILYEGTGVDAKAFEFTNIRFSSYGVYVAGAKDGVTMDSSFVSNNSIGIYRPSTLASVTVTGTDIHSNTTGIQNQSNGPFTISTSNIYNNATYGFYHSATGNATATNNYWGAASGPLVQTGPDLNPTGTGNKIHNASSGYVLYRPFMTARGGVLAGDVSQNGTISAFDGSLVLQYVVSAIVLSPGQQTAADVTANGVITALDASYILRYVVGIVTGFPGLGKTVGAPAAPGYDLVFEPTSDGSAVEAFVRLRASGILSTQFAVSFDTLAWSPSGVFRTAGSDSFQIASHVNGNTLKVALAGLAPVTHDGQWVRIRFDRVQNSNSSAAAGISITSFMVNEATIVTKTDDEMAGAMPTTFELGQNYPNPFNPSTTVRFQLPEASTVTIKVFDVLGREVVTLVEGSLNAGFHQVAWHGSDARGSRVSSGMYLVTMTAQSAEGQPYRSVRKMILTK